MRRMQESLSRITVYQLKQQNEMVSVTGRERTQAQTEIQSLIWQFIQSARYIQVREKSSHTFALHHTNPHANALVLWHRKDSSRSRETVNTEKDESQKTNSLVNNHKSLKLTLPCLMQSSNDDKIRAPALNRHRVISSVPRGELPTFLGCTLSLTQSQLG